MAKNKMMAVCVARNVKPTFEHDCPQCRFVAHIDGHDAYVCKGPMQDVVLRFGNDGPAYRSLPSEMAPANTVYSLVVKLVGMYDDGLVSKNKYYTRPLKREFQPLRPQHLQADYN